jgi:hypothetical protein
MNYEDESLMTDRDYDKAVDHVYAKLMMKDFRSEVLLKTIHYRRGVLAGIRYALTAATFDESGHICAQKPFAEYREGLIVGIEGAILQYPQRGQFINLSGCVRKQTYVDSLAVIASGEHNFTLQALCENLIRDNTLPNLREALAPISENVGGN